MVRPYGLARYGFTPLYLMLGEDAAPLLVRDCHVLRHIPAQSSRVMELVHGDLDVRRTRACACPNKALNVQQALFIMIASCS